MDDVAGAGTRFAQGVDMGHHVMPKPALVLLGASEIDVIKVSADFLNLLGPNSRSHTIVAGHAQFVLSLGQSQPKPSPSVELSLRAPELGHLSARVASDQRIVVNLGFHVSKRVDPFENPVNRFTSQGHGDVLRRSILVFGTDICTTLPEAFAFLSLNSCRVELLLELERQSHYVSKGTCMKLRGAGG